MRSYRSATHNPCNRNVQRILLARLPSASIASGGLESGLLLLTTRWFSLILKPSTHLAILHWPFGAYYTSPKISHPLRLRVAASSFALQYTGDNIPPGKRYFQSMKTSPCQAMIKESLPYVFLFIIVISIVLEDTQRFPASENFQKCCSFFFLAEVDM